MVMDLNKHIVTNATKADHFHSNGYAIAANGQRIGSASYVSFGQRQQRGDGRQVVESYRNSRLGRSYGVLRAKSVTQSDVNLSRGQVQSATPPPSGTGGRGFNVSSRSVTRPSGFVEPPARNYNPYK